MASTNQGPGNYLHSSDLQLQVSLTMFSFDTFCRSVRRLVAARVTIGPTSRVQVDPLHKRKQKVESFRLSASEVNSHCYKRILTATDPIQAIRIIQHCLRATVAPLRLCDTW